MLFFVCTLDRYRKRLHPCEFLILQSKLNSPDPNTPQIHVMILPKQQRVDHTWRRQKRRMSLSVARTWPSLSLRFSAARLLGVMFLVGWDCSLIILLTGSTQGLVLLYNPLTCCCAMFPMSVSLRLLLPPLHPRHRHRCHRHRCPRPPAAATSTTPAAAAAAAAAAVVVAAAVASRRHHQGCVGCGLQCTWSLMVAGDRGRGFRPD